MASGSVEELNDRVLRAEARYITERDKLVQSTLLHASDKFNTDEADPGWDEELHEDMVDEQIEQAHAAKVQFQVAKRNLEEAIRLGK